MHILIILILEINSFRNITDIENLAGQLFMKETLDSFMKRESSENSLIFNFLGHKVLRGKIVGKSILWNL